MATQNLSAQTAEGNTPTYRTRYGLTTAKKAAYDLLDRSWARLRFLEDVLAVAHHDGDGFTMTGYSSCGLAAILEDIAHDVYAAHAYYIGDDSEPGKEPDMPEVRS